MLGERTRRPREEREMNMTETLVKVLEGGPSHALHAQDRLLPTCKRSPLPPLLPALGTRSCTSTAGGHGHFTDANKLLRFLETGELPLSASRKPAPRPRQNGQ